MIATYRLGIASIFYVCLTRVKIGPIWPSFTGAQRKIAFISGVFLTIHFATWITSLKYTSVASSVVIVQSAPIFVATGSFLFLKERPTVLITLGICISLAGCIIISAHDFSMDQTTLIGNLLAIGGAIGAAGYIIAGRKLRASIDTFRYVTCVYSVTALLLLIITMGSGISLAGYSWRIYALLFAIALFPQIIGHTIINWALKYISATTISVVLLGEPIGASLLALSLLGETLGFVKIIGGVIIIIGVIMVLLAEAKKEN